MCKSYPDGKHQQKSREFPGIYPGRRFVQLKLDLVTFCDFKVWQTHFTKHWLAEDTSFWDFTHQELDNYGQL
jgi:hypothetical protein